MGTRIEADPERGIELSGSPEHGQDRSRRLGIQQGGDVNDGGLGEVGADALSVVSQPAGRLVIGPPGRGQPSIAADLDRQATAMLAPRGYGDVPTIDPAFRHGLFDR